MSRTLFVVGLLLSLTLAGCRSATPAPTPPPLPATAVSLATPSTVPTLAVPVTPLSRENIPLGAERPGPVTGFTYQPIEGYILEESSTSATMMEPGVDPNVGPTLYLTAGTAQEMGLGDMPAEQQVEALISRYIGDLVPDGNTTLPLRQVIVDRVKGLDREYVIFGETPVRGQITVVRLADGRLFSLIGTAPPDRWDNEFRYVYRAVLNGITLPK